LPEKWGGLSPLDSKLGGGSIPLSPRLRRLWLPWIGQYRRRDVFTVF